MNSTGVRRRDTSNSILQWWLLVASLVATGRATSDAIAGASSGDSLQFSLSDPHRKENVVVLDVTTNDRLDYKFSNDDGSYQYGYQTGRLNNGGHSFRHEYRRPDGVLFGQHGYQLPNGVNQTVNYVADARGYRVLNKGQHYEPMAAASTKQENQVVASGTHQRLVPDISLLKSLNNVEKINMPSDIDELLRPEPIAPRWQHDPETGAYRFRYRSVGDKGAVAFRSEVRRPDGLVYGQYGHDVDPTGAKDTQQKTARRSDDKLVHEDQDEQASPVAAAARGPGHQRPQVVSYVADAFGYRLVDPSQGAVPVLSRQSALTMQRKSKLEKDEWNGVGRGSRGRRPAIARPSASRAPTVKLEQRRRSSSRRRQNSSVQHQSAQSQRQSGDKPEEQRTSSEPRKENPAEAMEEESSGSLEMLGESDISVEDVELLDMYKPLQLQQASLSQTAELTSVGVDANVDNELSSIVVESADIDQADSSDSQPLDDPLTADFADEHTPSILQLLAPYPSHLAASSGKHTPSSHPDDLQPYGAIKRLLLRSNDVVSDVMARRPIKDENLLAAAGIFTYQSMPYALVPLNLLPIRTYRVNRRRKKASPDTFSIVVEPKSIAGSQRLRDDRGVVRPNQVK